MRRIDGIVGNRHDDPGLEERIAAHEREGTFEQVVIGADERKKSRLRVETDAGTDLGIVVQRPELRPGDVLFVEETAAAVIAFEEREAYVIELPDPGGETVSAAVELGHRIGNQHWDIAVEGETIYVPLDVEKRILEDVLGPYLPAEATTRYESVDGARFVDGMGSGHGTPPHGQEGGADEDGHSHGSADGHEHRHE
jgi:urease accessory protein